MKFTFDDLNDNEKKAIEKLRMKVKDVLKPNMYEDNLLFYRFLKARDMRIDDAEAMLRKHMIWRKVYQVDTILDDFKFREFFTKYIEPNIFGLDKDGSLVLYLPCGKMEAVEVYKCEKKRIYFKYWIKCVEMYRSLYKTQYEKTGHNACQISFILDLDQLTLSNATSKDTADFFLGMISIYQDNYPEHLKACYLINAPPYYVFVMAVVRAVMSNSLTQKILAFGHSGWKEKLLEEMDADILPAFLGGNLTGPDGDPWCKSFVRHGGPIPKKYFLSSEERYFKDRPGVKRITVLNKKKEEIRIDVKEARSFIQWEFYCKSNIGFGLFRENSNQELEEIIPIVKYFTYDGTEKDSFKARSVGKYVIVFDNTDSFFSSKEVEYCIELIYPE